MLFSNKRIITTLTAHTNIYLLLQMGYRSTVCVITCA